MIEFRYLRHPRTSIDPDVLQYRRMVLGLDASGALVPTTQWTAWQSIPIVIGDLADPSNTKMELTP